MCEKGSVTKPTAGGGGRQLFQCWRSHGLQGLSAVSLGQCGGTEGQGENPKTNLLKYFYLLTKHPVALTTDPEIKKGD